MWTGVRSDRGSRDTRALAALLELGLVVEGPEGRLSMTSTGVFWAGNLSATLCASFAAARRRVVPSA